MHEPASNGSNSTRLLRLKPRLCNTKTRMLKTQRQLCVFCLIGQDHGFVEVQAVANAAVPIVKMVDGRGSGLHVDICFNNMLGVANTRCARRSALHGAHVVGSSSSITVQYLFILDS